MPHRLRGRTPARHREAGTVGVHIDPTQAGGLVYETLSAIFAPVQPGAGRIVSDGGPVVSTRSFDVRRQRPLSEPVLLGEAVRALVFGRPKDIKRLVDGLQAHFTVGHGEQEHELVIGPKQRG
ncbi:hypothetical protein [Streptomyces sp. NPDC019890]|uniref:hypothetical protein n=1 Tax=Streptomyces sp. NPDC019890 TaxID=3365064 RepID=UPI00384D990D